MSQTVRTLYLGTILTFALVGCLVRSGAVKPPKPSGKATLEELSFQSFQNRDIVRAELLEKAAAEIRAGTLKYDGPCMERMAAAGKQSADQTWKPVAEKAQAAMAGEKWDAVKAEKLFLDVAKGSRRAGQ